LSPRQIGRLCPKEQPGASVSPQTVVRWIVEGVRLRGGGRLRLPAIRYPSGWKIDQADFETFIADLTADRV
jgi:hypothetical protein